MDLLDRLRDRARAANWAKHALAWLAAFLYYVIVVAGEIGRTGSIILSAVPAALVLVFFWWRPTTAIVLSATGIALVAFFAVNGGAVQSAVQQVSATVAIFGAARSADARVRDLGRLFTVFAGVAAAVFLTSRWFSGGEPLITLGLPFLLLLFGPWLLARALQRTRVLSARLVETTERGESAERDVLVELERNRIAREVHDVVAHSLAVVIAQADGARFAAETKPETVAPALEAISDTARRALGEVRTMLHDLRTSGDGSVPGADDLDALVDGVRELGVGVDRVVWGEPAPLDRIAGLALYRIAQEALTNAMRHGDRDDPVGFELDWGERQVVLIVTNAMSGEAPVASERAGQGLVGMRERAADAGGDCTAGPGSNGRFRVRVVLPVAAPEPDPAPVAVNDPLGALFGRLGVEPHG